MAQKGEKISEEHKKILAIAVKKWHEKMGHNGNYCPVCGKKILNVSKACGRHRFISQKTREKISKRMIGTHQSQATLAKLSKIRKGKKPWNLGIAGKRGVDNPNYKGYLRTRDDMRTLEYKQWRTEVFKRDNFICRICGTTGGRIMNAHHIQRYIDYPEKRYDINNGVTLCKTCHCLVHSKNYKGIFLMK